MDQVALYGAMGGQNSMAGQRGGVAPAAAPAQRGGRGGAPVVQTMTLTTTAWTDGGMIPLRYTQAGAELSPMIQWSGAPQGTVSFVLTFHDADTAAANSTDGLLHWMIWNIPATATNMAQGQADGFELENGMRQISANGFRYRGPGAAAGGPLHHYVMELYALDTMLDIKVTMPGPQEPNPNVQAIRTSIMQAMVGHVRGKGAYVGLFHRSQ
jgi:Raf kinase inhibitor-like YbhB/YbcL family protein